MYCAESAPPDTLDRLVSVGACAPACRVVPRLGREAVEYRKPCFLFFFAESEHMVPEGDHHIWDYSESEHVVPEGDHHIPLHTYIT